MKSREQMPRSAELDSPRQVIVSCSWDTSANAGGQGGRAACGEGRGAGGLHIFPSPAPPNLITQPVLLPIKPRTLPLVPSRLPPVSIQTPSGCSTGDGPGRCPPARPGLWLPMQRHPGG